MGGRSAATGQLCFLHAKLSIPKFSVHRSNLAVSGQVKLRRRSSSRGEAAATAVLAFVIDVHGKESVVRQQVRTALLLLPLLLSLLLLVLVPLNVIPACCLLFRAY